MCDEQMKRLISGHLDGCNTEKQEATLAAHLQECAECRRLLKEYEAIDAKLSEMSLTPPSGFCANVMNAISKEAPQSKKEPKHAFRYGTMIAAAAAVLVLAVSAGHIALPKGGSAAIYPSVVEEAAAEAPDEEAFEAEKTTKMADAAPAEEPNITADEAPMEYHAQEETEPTMDVFLFRSAYEDCTALANEEGCYVGLLYLDNTPNILINYPFTPLPGGNLYVVTPELLNELQSYFPNIQIFAPEGMTPEEGKEAYLFLMNDPG